MAWVTSSVNGNVIEVADEALVEKFKAEGHKVTESDPRLPKPKPKAKK